MTDGERRSGKARDQVGGELCASVSERGRNRREGRGREGNGKEQCVDGWKGERKKREKERVSPQRGRAKGGETKKSEGAYG